MFAVNVVQTVSSPSNLCTDEQLRAETQMDSLEGGECKQSGWRLKAGTDEGGALLECM